MCCDLRQIKSESIKLVLLFVSRLQSGSFKIKIQNKKSKLVQSHAGHFNPVLLKCPG